MPETTTAAFTFVKAGVFYFTRRVPHDLSHHYTARRICYSLRTRSSVVAGARARQAAQRLDEHWYHLRLQDCDLPGKHLLRSTGRPSPQPITAPTQQGQSQDAVTLSEAMGIYLRLKGQGKSKTFHRAAERSCGYVVEVCGDKPINSYTKAEANTFRDALIERGLAGTSITRTVGTVRAIINFAASETGIDVHNPFVKLYYDRSAGVSERQPLPDATIRNIQQECEQVDDDARRLVALVSDTGLRLAEAAGLLLDDIKLDADIPHIVVQEHPWRRLKTSGSKRLVPLAGASLVAAQRLVEDGSGATKFAFPRYNKSEETNANSASAALNKWLRPRVPAGCTMHSFRHSMRDRLRAVECPADIVDQIGGWQTDGVGQGYGKGYPLTVLTKWLETAVKPK